MKPAPCGVSEITFPGSGAVIRVLTRNDDHALRGSSCHIAGPCGCGLPKGFGVRA